MPFSYLQLKRSLALSLAQIVGSDQDSLETAYTGDWDTMLDGAEIPLTAFKDQILMVEKVHATAIGNNAQHPARSFLYAQTANLNDLDAIPSVDNAGVEIVGVWDSCADAGTNRPCTWVPTQTISDLVDGAPDFFTPEDYFYYNINGNFIRTTQSSVFLQGCSWDYDTQSNEYDSDGDSPLPEGEVASIMDDVIARSAQCGWTDSASVAQYFNARAAADNTLISGVPNIPLTSQNNLAGG